MSATAAPSETVPPHSTTNTFHFGASREDATHAIVLLHGRGGSPTNIAMVLHDAFITPTTESKLCILVPEADNRSWYPLRFNGGVENEPALNAAVDRVEKEVKGLELAGIKRERIMIGGFSQGACLAAKFAFTHPAKYGGFFIFSGALPGMRLYIMDKIRGLGEFEGVDLQGTMVFIMSGDVDHLI